MISLSLLKSLAISMSGDIFFKWEHLKYITEIVSDSYCHDDYQLIRVEHARNMLNDPNREGH